MFKGPKILPSQQLGAAVAPWPGATGLIASVTADDMAHKGESLKISILIGLSEELFCTEKKISLNLIKFMRRKCIEEMHWNGRTKLII